MDGNPVVKKTEFGELLKALAPLEVVWNHVPGHQGIEGNEATDQLARAAIEKDEPEVMTPLEDGTFHKDSIDEPKGTTETIINISPNCTNSEDSDSLDEEPDAPEAVSDTPPMLGGKEFKNQWLNSKNPFQNTSPTSWIRRVWTS